MSRFCLVTAMVGVLLLCASGAQAADPLITLQVPASGGVLSKAKLRAGVTYVMTISGSRTKNYGGGTFETNDAFYCFASDPRGACPPKAPQPISGAAITSSTGLQAAPLQQSLVGEPPSYSPTHTYTVRFRPTETGKLSLGTSVICGGGSVTCTGEGFRVEVFAPAEDDPCAAATARAAAVNEVRAVAVIPGAEVHKAGAPEDDWVALCKDAVLQQGDEIAVDADGSVTLQFADGTTTVVRNTTQLKIASYFTEGGVVKTEILLKMGEVAAKVRKSEATKSDFRIKSPTAAVSVRGTDFQVFYDPGAKATLTSVFEGLVEVDPVVAGLATAQVPAGQEVEVTASAISPIAALGKAGARGGIGRRDALARVVKLIARGNGPCRSSTPREGAFAVRPAPGGWAVSVKLTGKLRGTSRWRVTRAGARPVDSRARRIAGRCR